MRHQRAGRKLGRDSAHRKALYANLTASLIEHGRIKTTVAKAKEVRPVAEEMITLGRRGGVPARRQALKFLRSQDVVHKRRATRLRWLISSSSTTCRGPAPPASNRSRPYGG